MSKRVGLTLFIHRDSFEFDGSTWALIFHHNSTQGHLFTLENARFNLQKNTYSLLSKVTNDFQIFDKIENEMMFEFMLIYPESNEYIIWKQNINPLHLYDLTDYKYRILNETKDYSTFQGLGICKTQESLLEGNPQTNYTWFFAIGSTEYWPEDNAFPGPNIERKGYHEVNLYIKVKNHSLLDLLSIFQNCSCSRNYIFHIHILSLIYILTL